MVKTGRFSKKVLPGAMRNARARRARGVMKAKAMTRHGWTVDIVSASSTIYSAPLPASIEAQMREASRKACEARSPFLRLLFGGSRGR